MRRNISTVSSKGFTLIELCIVMVILAILAGSATPVFIKKIQIKAGEKTALEISAVEQAALAYYVVNNVWPSNIQTLQSSGYMNPSWSANNPWQNSYSISSTPNSFTVSTTVPSEWTALVARDLPTSSTSANSVSSTVPSPGSLSLPKGSIIMWSGTIASIPVGWQLCDGTNGTPDLRDKFIVGANQDAGGVAETIVSGTLTRAGGSATHIHEAGTLLGPAHTHGFSTTTSGPSSGGGAHCGDDGYATRWHTHTVTGTTDTGNSGGPVTGETASASSLPPYYALAFIIKV